VTAARCFAQLKKADTVFLTP